MDLKKCRITLESMIDMYILTIYTNISVGATSLDRRPTTILVSDVDVDIKDAVLAHMSKFGEVVDTTGES